MEEINWGGPTNRPRSKINSYDELIELRCQNDPLVRKIRIEFYQALSEGNSMEVGRVWNLMQEHVGGMKWKDIPCEPSHTAVALGVLATLSTGKLCLETRIKQNDEVQLINAILLESPRRRVFGELFEQLSIASDRYMLLNRDTVREKLERAKAETVNIGLAKRIGPVYDAFIPQGSFRRLILPLDQEDKC
jgi:hypothetical protein